MYYEMKNQQYSHISKHQTNYFILTFWVLYNCYITFIYTAGSNLVDADSICGQDTNECFPIVMPKHFSTILFQRFRCHTSLQYPVHVVRKYIESKLLKMQDIFVQVIEDLMWGSLVLFYETRSSKFCKCIK